MEKKASAKGNAPVILFMSAVLMFNLWRAVALPGGEYSPAPLPAMYFGLDLAMTGILVILIATLRMASAALRALVTVVGLAGFAAGAAMVWIRLSTDAGWWTGHLTP